MGYLLETSRFTKLFTRICTVYASDLGSFMRKRRLSEACMYIYIYIICIYIYIYIGKRRLSEGCLGSPFTIALEQWRHKTSVEAQDVGVPSIYEHGAVGFKEDGVLNSYN